MGTLCIQLLKLLWFRDSSSRYSHWLSNANELLPNRKHATSPNVCIQPNTHSTTTTSHDTQKWHCRLFFIKMRSSQNTLRPVLWDIWFPSWHHTKFSTVHTYTLHTVSLLLLSHPNIVWFQLYWKLRQGVKAEISVWISQCSTLNTGSYLLLLNPSCLSHQYQH